MTTATHEDRLIDRKIIGGSDAVKPTPAPAPAPALPPRAPTLAFNTSPSAAKFRLTFVSI
jgi:hypothetical protein